MAHGKHIEERRVLSDYDIKKLLIPETKKVRIGDVSFDEKVDMSTTEPVIVMARKGSNIIVSGAGSVFGPYRKNSPVTAIVVRCSCDDYSLNICEAVRLVIVRETSDS